LYHQQNYCGELLFWWGTFIAGMNVGPTVSDDASIVVLVGYMFTSISIVGPLCMTALFFGISVDLMEARQLKNKKIEYEKYKKKVPSAILLCPRCGGGNGGRNRNEEKEE
jgi:steroid 5-alpha reductase family enzyme